MKKVIGAEISRRNEPTAEPSPEPAPAPENDAAPKSTVRRSKNVLDLREPQAASTPPEPQVTPGAPEPKVPVSEPVSGGEEEVVSPAAPNPATPGPAAQQPAPKKKRLRLPWSRISADVAKVAIVLAASVFFLSLNTSLPERIIGIYAVIAIIYRIDSQRTFLVALIFLVMVAVWSAFGNSTSAESYAVYAFYFLVVGLATAMRELLSTGKKALS